MDKEEWLKEIEGHTPGPWKVNYGGITDKIEITTQKDFLWFCREIWRKTKKSGSMGKHLYVVYGKDEQREEVVVAIVGNGPKAPMNASLIAGAPVLLKQAIEGA